MKMHSKCLPNLSDTSSLDCCQDDLFHALKINAQKSFHKMQNKTWIVDFSGSLLYSQDQ